MTEAAWENSNDKQINIPVGSTVLINIAGTNVAFNGGLAINGQQNDFDPAIPGILYNFASATSLQPSNIAVLGSVLAPLADLTLTGGDINGITIVANALTQNGGEFHNRGFTGTLPNPSVPEPWSVALAPRRPANRRRRRASPLTCPRKKRPRKPEGDKGFRGHKREEKLTRSGGEMPGINASAAPGRTPRRAPSNRTGPKSLPGRGFEYWL